MNYLIFSEFTPPNRYESSPEENMFAFILFFLIAFSLVVAIISIGLLIDRIAKKKKNDKKTKKNKDQSEDNELYK